MSGLFATALANAFVLACSLAALSFSYRAWRDRFAPTWKTAGSRGRHVSWALLVGHFIAELPLLGQSRDVYALATEGPSSQNLVQAALLAATAAWVFHLLARGHVPGAALGAGPAFWVSSLTAIYAASTAWSVWPAVTLYRVVELGVFWVLLIHLVTNQRWDEAFRALLWLAIAAAWATQLLYLDMASSPGTLVGFAYSNVSTLIAAALLLVEVQRVVLRPSLGGWMLCAFAALSVLAFGSLATSIALIIAGGVYLAAQGRAKPKSRELLFVGALVVCAATAAVAFQPLGGPGDDLVAEVAELSGKDVGSIESLTGRLPLWAAVLRMTASEPLGLGFAGAERVLALGFVQVSEVGWTASHAHNGYLSAWLAAGWPGLLLTTLIFIAVWRRRLELSPKLRPLVAALAVLLAINNLTAPAVGSHLGAPWMIMMALACAPPRLPSRLEPPHTVAEQAATLGRR